MESDQDQPAWHNLMKVTCPECGHFRFAYRKDIYQKTVNFDSNGNITSVGPERFIGYDCAECGANVGKISE